MDGKTVTKDTRSQTAEDLLPNVKLFRTPRHVNRYTGTCRSNLQMIFHLSERQRRGRTDRMNVQSSRGDSSSVRKTTPGRTDRMNVQIFHLSKDNAYERPIFEQFFVCLKDGRGPYEGPIFKDSHLSERQRRDRGTVRIPNLQKIFHFVLKRERRTHLQGKEGPIFKRFLILS